MELKTIKKVPVSKIGRKITLNRMGYQGGISTMLESLYDKAQLDALTPEYFKLTREQYHELLEELTPRVKPFAVEAYSFMDIPLL